MGDDDRDARHPRDAHADGPSRLQLVFDHERNRELLAEWLADGYEVQQRPRPVLDETVDLCIVDEGAFAQYEGALREWKEAVNPVFAPVVLVSEERVSEAFDPDSWQTVDGLYIVDDVVSAPVEKPVLHRRLENLLGRRSLSKRLDSRYRRSEERFASLFTTLPDPAFVTDVDGTLRHVNDTFRRYCVSNGPEAVVLGESLREVGCFDDEAIETIQEYIATAIDGGRPDPAEIGLTTPAGEALTVDLNAGAAAIDGEQVVTVVLRDVTERVEKEARLLESEQRFQQIAENIHEVIWMTDDRGDLLYVSAGYEEITGRSADTLRGTHLSTALDHVHRDDREAVQDKFEALFADLHEGEWAETYHFEHRLVDTDGDVHWAEIDAYPLVTPDGTRARVVGLVDDISERKRRENELKRQNERLEEFASIVSHDLRNPLQVIDGHRSLIEEEGVTGDNLAAIERSTDRMQQLIDDLLSLARQGETVSDVEAVDLATVTQSAWASIDAPAATLSVEDDVVVQADENRLRQLFENLFRNAVEHGTTGTRSQTDDPPDADSGTGDVTEIPSGEGLTVRVGALDGGFYVEDNGSGIPPDHREDVFERGYSTQDDGTGFGLNIVADIVGAHDWDVTATAAEDGGARFEITGVETA
ncbi:PAS domain S-box protein [Haloarcula marina]|uniref:PAS domain S-box protein n=1 Tax=Haloarcula marina TaxID=2961574 RepID=UPI0020B63DEE|nr:PAS domain S-box protein [Halomicroarcula marina]